jgi:L-alanine-DL-glutamate epimerase-like enolase superfamily enzyme
MAHAAGRPVVPHAANLSLVTLFTMHYLAAVPNSGGWLEFSVESDAGLNQQARAMFSPALTVKDGHVRLSGEPGWGVHINEAWLASAERQVSQLPA